MRVVGVVVVFDTAGSWSCVAFARPGIREAAKPADRDRTSFAPDYT